MKIFVVGRQREFEECSQKLAGHDLLHIDGHAELKSKLTGDEIVFDFTVSENPESYLFYREARTTVFLNSWKISIRELVHRYGTPASLVFGFNGFPTLFNREFLEVTTWRPYLRDRLTDICQQLGTPCHVVDDRIGLVTPRVICMIINEAYFTVQEGTATREDIDIAMKLGTNYPYGPFEWCERIGLKYVYELLDAVYLDTRDERYRTSALMKKEYLEPGNSQL